METLVILATAAFWFYVLLAISNKMQSLEKENKELKASNKELLEANYKLAKK